MLYLNLAAVLAHASDRLLVTDSAPTCPTMERKADICGNLKVKLDYLKNEGKLTGDFPVYAYATAGARGKKSGLVLKKNRALMNGAKEVFRTEVTKCLKEWSDVNAGSTLTLSAKAEDFRVLKSYEEAKFALEAVAGFKKTRQNIAIMEMGGTSLQVAYFDDLKNQRATSLLSNFGATALMQQLLNKPEGAFCFQVDDKWVQGVEWDKAALDWKKCLEAVKKLRLNGVKIAPFRANTHYYAFGSFYYTATMLKLVKKFGKSREMDVAEFVREVTAAAERDCQTDMDEAVAEANSYTYDQTLKLEEELERTEKRVQQLEAKIAAIEAPSGARRLAELTAEEKAAKAALEEKNAKLAELRKAKQAALKKGTTDQYDHKKCMDAAWVIRMMHEMMSAQHASIKGTRITLTNFIDGVELGWARGKAEMLFKADDTMEKAVIMDIGSTSTKVHAFSKTGDVIDEKKAKFKVSETVDCKNDDKGWFTLKN